MNQVLRHPYHLVSESLWPLFSAGGALGVTTGLVEAFHYHFWGGFFFAILILGLVSLNWWLDVSLEGTFLGAHSKVVQSGLRMGMLLFIVSEVLFFFSFFWTFFHLSLSPSFMLGSTWPPEGISTFSAFQVPLLNTLLLLSSGVSVTWAHLSLSSNNFFNYCAGLAMTVILAFLFLGVQALEYIECKFSMSDSSFGSIFFLMTGFHGFHVLVGLLFLLFTFFRTFHLSGQHHFGFEAASWYWHFVDVVWLFLFIVIYWWSGL